MTTAEIEKMSLAERLEAMERLWESLCRKADEVPFPAWHAEVLAERRAAADAGDVKWLTLDEARQRLRR